MGITVACICVSANRPWSGASTFSDFLRFLPFTNYVSLPWNLLRSLPFFCIKMTTEVFYLDISSGHHLIGQPELEVFTFTSAFSKFHRNLMSNSRYSSLFSLLLAFYDN